MMTSTRWFWLMLAMAAFPLALSGCSDDDDDDDDDTTPTTNDDDDDTTVDDDDDDDTTETCPIESCSPIEDLVDADSADCACVSRIEFDPACDPLVPQNCAMPFPSNHFLKADAATETGFRVNFTATSLPKSIEDIHINPTEFNRFDGFSPASQILFHFDALVDGANLPPITDIGKSLEDESPTVLLDAETGEMIVHFTEVDAREAPDSERPVILRPMVLLENDRRYIVAVRNLVDTDGYPIEPSPAFLAYRDDIDSGIPGIEARREAMEDIFDTLETAGIERSSLQLAWDFTTASRDSIAGSLVGVSDMALAAIDAEGSYQYQVTEVLENVNSNTQTRIEGKVRFPLFLRNDIVGLNAWDPGSELNRNEDGEIEQNGWVDQVPFRVQIPPSVASGEKQARFMVYGHGLLGSRGESNGGYLNQVANQYGFVIIATDWWGLNEQDAVYVGAKVLPDFSNFYHITDRFHQGVLNTSLLSDFILKTFAASDDFASGGVKINNWLPEVYYYGNSQGGIMGVPAVAIDRNVERAVFGVPGIIYSILIPRSSDFVDLDEVMKIFYPSELDWQLAMSASQMLWDRVEPVSYINRLFNDPVDGRPVKTAIWQIGVGDAQVNPVTMDIAARTMGIPQLGPANYPIYGVDEVSAPHNGSAVVYYDPELETNPLDNTFPPSDEGTHEAVRRSPASQMQLNAFLQPGGAVEQFCTDTCDADDHPEAHQ